MRSPDLKAEDVKRLLIGVYKRYLSGSITEAQAWKETYLLNSILKAIEVTDLEQRLTEIQTTLKRD
jgi:hypothetical protein